MIKITKPMSRSEVCAQPQLDATLTESAEKPAAAKSAPEKAAAKVQEAKPRFNLRALALRVKSVKHIEIYAVIAIVAVICLLFFSTLSVGGGKKANANLTSAEDVFVREMEQKLVSTLSGVSGAGKISAMVTAVGSATLEIAYDLDEKTITQGSGTASTTTTTINKTPVLVGGKPIVLLEVKPKLKGVVIVAGGANNPNVRLALLRAVQTLVADPTVKIEILVGN